MPYSPPQPPQPGPLAVHAACALPPAHALPPPGPHLAAHRTRLLSTRQKAKAFNQPLSFDTSRVTTMDTMFYVHSACALRPHRLQSSLPFCTLHALSPPHRPPRLPAHTPPHIKCPPVDSAACDGVQPAAELRHVQRHGHALHAQGALCSRVLRPHRLQSSPPLHATCASTAPPTILSASQTAPRSPTSYGPLLSRGRKRRHSTSR